MITRLLTTGRALVIRPILLVGILKRWVNMVGGMDVSG